jgi:hypothetical protein
MLDFVLLKTLPSAVLSTCRQCLHVNHFNPAVLLDVLILMTLAGI